MAFHDVQLFQASPPKLRWLAGCVQVAKGRFLPCCAGCMTGTRRDYIFTESNSVSSKLFNLIHCLMRTLHACPCTGDPLGRGISRQLLTSFLSPDIQLKYFSWKPCCFHDDVKECFRHTLQDRTCFSQACHWQFPMHGPSIDSVVPSRLFRNVTLVQL
jgi:hypothetical protein